MTESQREKRDLVGVVLVLILLLAAAAAAQGDPGRGGTREASVAEGAR